MGLGLREAVWDSVRGHCGTEGAVRGSHSSASEPDGEGAKVRGVGGDNGGDSGAKEEGEAAHRDTADSPG